MNVFEKKTNMFKIETAKTKKATLLPFSLNFRVIKPPVAVPQANPKTPNIAVEIVN